jgi:hypothetical protein
VRHAASFPPKLRPTEYVFGPGKPRPRGSSRVVRLMRSETLQAIVVLLLVLNAGFYPSVWGDPGTHQIEFRYEPKSYLYGGLIGLVALSAGRMVRCDNAARQHARSAAP